MSVGYDPSEEVQLVHLTIPNWFKYENHNGCRLMMKNKEQIFILNKKYCKLQCKN